MRHTHTHTHTHTYECDHWGTWASDLWGNFANPPWADWVQPEEPADDNPEEVKPDESEDRTEVDPPRPPSDTSSASSESGDESPAHTSVTTTRSMAVPKAAGGPAPQDTTYEPEWAPGSSPIELVCRRLAFEYWQNQQQPPTGITSAAGAVPPPPPPGFGELGTVTASNHPTGEPPGKRGKLGRQPATTHQRTTTKAGSTTQTPPTTLARALLTPNPPGVGAVLPAAYQVPSDAWAPTDSSLLGMACDYAASGNYPTCIGRAEVWLKTSKYEQLCRSRAAWAQEQQAASRNYINSQASSRAAPLPPAEWGSSGTTAAAAPPAQPRVPTSKAPPGPEPWATIPGRDPWASSEGGLASSPATSAQGSRLMSEDDEDRASGALAPFQMLEGRNAKTRKDNRSGAYATARSARQQMPRLLGPLPASAHTHPFATALGQSGASHLFHATAMRGQHGSKEPPQRRPRN
jgi:hypothetical protein